MPGSAALRIHSHAAGWATARWQAPGGIELGDGRLLIKLPSRPGLSDSLLTRWPADTLSDEFCLAIGCQVVDRDAHRAEVLDQKRTVEPGALQPRGIPALRI
jgi:hypothetical protein